MSEAVIYNDPPENLKSRGKEIHSFEIYINGENVAGVDFGFYENPELKATVLYVEYLGVEEEHQQKGFGKRILQEINTLCQENNVIGLLWDRIDKDNPARGMYERNGWVSLKDVQHPEWYVYNMPEGIPHEKILSTMRTIRGEPDET